MGLCTHVLTRINLNDNQILINVQNTTNEISNVVTSSTTPRNSAHRSNASESNVSGSIEVLDTVATNQTVTKKSVVEMRGLRA